MVSLGDVKRSAATLFAQGQHLAALRLYDAIVAAAPLDYDARIRVADCALALGDRCAPRTSIARPPGTASRRAIRSPRSSARACSRRTAPIASDIVASLVVTYGSESELLGKVADADRAARRDAPDRRSPTCACPRHRMRSRPRSRAPSTRPTSSRTIPSRCTRSRCCRRCRRPRFGACSARCVLRRLPVGALVIREGEPGNSFFFVAGGQLRVFATDGLGRQTELAQLGENAVFGEMALLSAQPRSASVGCADRGRSARGRPPVARRARRRARPGRRGAARVHARAPARQPDGDEPRCSSRSTGCSSAICCAGSRATTSRRARS